MVDVQGSTRTSESHQGLLRSRLVGPGSVHQFYWPEQVISAQAKGKGKLTPSLKWRCCNDSLQRDREGNNYGHFKINLKHHLLPILVKIDYPLIIFYGFSNFVTLLLIIFQYFILAQIIAISVHIYALVQAEIFVTLLGDARKLIYLNLWSSIILSNCKIKLDNFLSDLSEYIMIKSERLQKKNFLVFIHKNKNYF